MSTSTTSTPPPEQKLPPGMVLGPDGKPCKACTSFQSFMGIKKKTPKASASAAVVAAAAAASVPTSYLSCPADKDELGRHTWTFLHTTASYYPPSPSPHQQSSMLSLLRSLPTLYPCSPCATELGEYMRLNPPDEVVKERGKLENWLCGVHNEVNERLGKEPFDCGTVGERWRDGWKDGRCD